MIEHVLPHFPPHTHPLTLALHAFFPDLAYPVVRGLTPAQRWRLSQSPPPPRRLGRRGTVEFLLHRVFAADLDTLRQPAHLVAWLNQIHGGGDSLPPPVLAEHLLAHLRKVPAYASWPLADLLASRDAFTTFVRDQWRAGARPRRPARAPAGLSQTTGPRSGPGRACRRMRVPTSTWRWIGTRPRRNWTAPAPARYA